MNASITLFKFYKLFQFDVEKKLRTRRKKMFALIFVVAKQIQLKSISHIFFSTRTLFLDMYFKGITVSAIIKKGQNILHRKLNKNSSL